MIEQLKKLRTKSIITLILAMLALTWQFLNYLTIKDILPMDNFLSLESIIIYSSYLFIIVLFLAIVSLVFSIFRISIKYNSEQKKIEKKRLKEANNKIEEKPEDKIELTK